MKEVSLDKAEREGLIVPTLGVPEGPGKKHWRLPLEAEGCDIEVEAESDPSTAGAEGGARSKYGWHLFI